MPDKTERWTPDMWRSYVQPLPAMPESRCSGTPATRQKYGNTPVVDPDTGKRIDSKLEAKHRAAFRQQLRAGAIRAYAPQVELVLPGNVGVRLDHLIVELDGTLSWYDTKGGTAARKNSPGYNEWNNKRKQLKALYGIDVAVLNA